LLASLISCSQEFECPESSFTENYVVGDLRKSSVECEAFYQAERGKITGQVCWVKDGQIEELNAAELETSEVNGKTIAVIHLREIPPSLDDAVTIAHELEHLVLNAEGFPITNATYEFKWLCLSLNELVSRPLINLRLQNFGLIDWCKSYDEQMEETLNGFKQTPSSYGPTDRLTRIQWIFQYSDALLRG
jgi:hypothetical protein